MTEAQALNAPGRTVVLPGRGEVFVRDTGNVDAPLGTVVLLHGWMFGADFNWITAWHPQPRALPAYRLRRRCRRADPPARCGAGAGTRLLDGWRHRPTAGSSKPGARSRRGPGGDLCPVARGAPDADRLADHERPPVRADPLQPPV